MEIEQQLQTTEFVVGLLRNGLYTPEHNLVLSPYSLVSALVMLMIGAGGNSRLQLAKSMFNIVSSSSSDDQDLALVLKCIDAFAAENSVTMQRNEKSLKIANFLYSSKR